MKQLTANVFVETRWVSGTRASAGSTSSFVTTEDGIVMVDAPLVPANALKWRDIIAEKGKLLYLINTGCHSDHTSGNFFFPAPVIAHEETRKAIPHNLTKNGEQGQKLKRNYPFCADLVQNYQMRLPSLTFSDRLTLYAGKHTFELIHFPGHTPGETGVYLPQERVLFTGDNFANGYLPKLSDCCPRENIASLKKILEMDVDYYVPGHGDAGNKETVRAYLALYQRCVDTVLEAIQQGMSKEEIKEKVRLPIPENLIFRHPEAEQLKKDVGRLYDMLVQSD